MSFFGGIFAGIIAGHSATLSMQPVFLSGWHSLQVNVLYLSWLVYSQLLQVLFLALCGQRFRAARYIAHAVSTSGAIGQFVYGTLNRALIPVGLHHVLNSYFWFGMGTCQEVLVTSAQAAGQAFPVSAATVCGPSLAGLHHALNSVFTPLNLLIQ